MAVKYHTDGCRYRLPEKRRTAAWLREVARSEGYVLGDVNYIFCSAARLLEMNRQFLGHDYFTDVITFDYSDRKGTRIVSGDIFIDVETVADNAASTAPQRCRRCGGSSYTGCCTSAVRVTRRPAPTRRCTARKINI